MKKKIILLSLGAFIGAILGFSYYYFVGCSTGTCPLTSTWYIPTLYGTAAGIIIAIPGRKKTKSK